MNNHYNIDVNNIHILINTLQSIMQLRYDSPEINHINRIVYDVSNKLEPYLRNRDHDLHRRSNQLQPHSTPIMQSQMQSHIQPQMQSRIQPQMQSRIQPQMQSRIQPQMQSRIQPQIQSIIQPQIQPRIQPQIQPQMQSRIQSRIQPIQYQTTSFQIPRIEQFSQQHNNIIDIANNIFNIELSSILSDVIGDVSDTDIHYEHTDTNNGTRISISHTSNETHEDPSSSLLDLILESVFENTNINDEDINSDVGIGEGLSIELIGKLPLAKYIEAKTDEENENSTMCTICQDDYQDETEVLCLPCTHLFHDGCIKDWLAKSTQCPNCRSSITKSDF